MGNTFFRPAWKDVVEDLVSASWLIRLQPRRALRKAALAPLRLYLLSEAAPGVDTIHRVVPDTSAAVVGLSPSLRIIRQDSTRELVLVPNAITFFLPDPVPVMYVPRTKTYVARTSTLQSLPAYAQPNTAPGRRPVRRRNARFGRTTTAGTCRLHDR